MSIAAIERKRKVGDKTVKRALATDETVAHHRRPGKRSPERRRALKVLQLAKAGTPKLEIVRRLKISVHTIYRVIEMDAAGLPVTIRPKRKPDAKRVQRLFKEGLSKSAIARRLDMSRMTVNVVLGPSVHRYRPIGLSASAISSHQDFQRARSRKRSR